MKRAVLKVLLLLLGCITLCAQDRQHVLDGTFTAITDVRHLPAPVKSAFTPPGSSRIDMANPGRWFQAGCVGTGLLPHKRLIFAAVSGDKCVVHYEQGGRAHSYYVMAFKLEPNHTATVVWRGACKRPAQSVDELRSMVASGAIVVR